MFITRPIPEAAAALLEAEGSTVRVAPHDRPIAADELHAGVATADALLCMLTDRVDAVKEAIDTFKSDGVVSGLVASGKALLKIVPCGGSVLKVIAKLF